MARSTARVWKLLPESSSVWSSLFIHKVSITFLHLFTCVFWDSKEMLRSLLVTTLCPLPLTQSCTQRRRSVRLFLPVTWLSSAHLCYLSLAERQCPWWGKAWQNQLAWIWILVPPLEMWSWASDVISLCLDFLILKEEWQYPSHVVHSKIQQC